MEFPRPEWFGGAKPSEDGEEALKRQLEELEEKHRMLDLEKGLDEWHIEVLEQEHGIDHLTGVATRKAFEAALAQAYDVMGRGEEESRRGARVVTEASVIFIDLDNFKQVNDTFGHQQGDATLKKAASLLHGALREEDMLARYGGDEFVALLINADEDNAAMVAEKLRVTLAADPELAKLGVTGSLGVCSSAASGAETPEALVKNADDAVYAAKHGGRNRVTVFRDGGA